MNRVSVAIFHTQTRAAGWGRATRTGGGEDEFHAPDIGCA